MYVSGVVQKGPGWGFVVCYILNVNVNVPSTAGPSQDASRVDNYPVTSSKHESAKHKHP